MKKIISVIMAIILLSSFLVSCGGDGYRDTVIYGMDTYITVRLPDDVGDERFTELENECGTIIASDEKMMSCHDEDALIYGLNGVASVLSDAPDELVSVLETALKVEAATGGKFSPTLGALTTLWNIKGGGPVPSADGIREALAHISSDSLKLEGNNIFFNSEEGQIDLGGVAKGYVCHSLVDYLSSEGLSYGVVSVGGNIGVFGEKDDGEPFKVALCDPDDTSNVVGQVEVKSGFMSVSGDYERFFEQDGKRYHHILDPETGYPAESGLRSVAVLSKSGAQSDALSTALFVMGAEEALEFYKTSDLDFEAIFITEDHEIILTDGLKNGSFELTNENYKLEQ